MAPRKTKRNIKRTIKRTMKRSNKMGGGKRSKKVKKTLKKSNSKGMNWMKALSLARKQLGLKGFITINKGKDGKALYNKAKALQNK